MYTPFTRDVADVRKKLMEEVDAFDTCNMVKFLRAVVPFVNEQWGAGVEVKIVLVTDAGLGGHGQFSLPGLLRGGVPDFDVCFPFPFRGQGCGLKRTVFLNLHYNPHNTLYCMTV